MSASIPFNYLPTTVAQGTFNVQSTGWVQGSFVPDPAIRYQLAGGVLASSETLPMWGGVAITEGATPDGSGVQPAPELGGLVARATTLANTTGFSVFDQNYAATITPGSPVPLTASGGLVNFFRLGSNARIVVKCAPGLTSLEGGAINQQVSWDFTASMLVPYVAAYPANVITAASWSATGGGKVTFTTTTNHGVAVGDVFEISGMTPAGYNGTFTAISPTATNSLVAVLTADPGASTVQGTLLAGGGALSVKVLDVQSANSMTVSYNSTTGFATWNYSDTVAVILI